MRLCGEALQLKVVKPAASSLTVRQRPTDGEQGLLPRQGVLEPGGLAAFVLRAFSGLSFLFRGETGCLSWNCSVLSWVDFPPHGKVEFPHK